MRHARDVCEGICNTILHYIYYTFFILLQIWGFGFGDDEIGPADESKRTKRVQGWSRQIMGERFLFFYYLQYSYIVK